MPEEHVALPEEYNHVYIVVLKGVIYINDNYTGGDEMIICPLSEVHCNG